MKRAYYPSITFRCATFASIFYRARIVRPLLSSAKRTICPYKGVATYLSLRGGPDAIAWSYDEPLPEGSGLTGHLSFDGEGVVVVVDDEPVLVREGCGFASAPPP